MEVGQDAYTLIPEFVLSDKIDWGNWARQTGHCGIKHRRSLRLTLRIPLDQLQEEEA